MLSITEEVIIGCASTSLHVQWSNTSGASSRTGTGTMGETTYSCSHAIMGAALTPLDHILHPFRLAVPVPQAIHGFSARIHDLPEWDLHRSNLYILNASQWSQPIFTEADQEGIAIISDCIYQKHLAFCSCQGGSRTVTMFLLSSRGARESATPDRQTLHQT